MTQQAKAEAKLVAKYKATIKKMDKTWRVLEDNRVPFLKEVLSWIDHPEQQMDVIQIAGTNGKGSTGAILSAVINASQLKVGHFSSPYVNDDREQITLNGEPITRRDFLIYFKQVTDALLKHGKSTNDLSYFEYFMMIALLYFEASSVNIAIIEAGLGGLRDATNAIDNAKLTVFTKISMDHENLMGHNVKEIAQNEAALIKPGTCVVSYAGQDIQALNVLKARTAAVGAEWFSGKIGHIIVENTSPNGLKLKIDDDSGYQLNLPGIFQAHNLNTVLQVLAALRLYGYQTSKEDLNIGLHNARMIGRMDYDGENNILYDAAHNVDGIQALVSTINSWHLKFKPTLVIGVLKDKDYHEMLDEIVPFVQRVITLTPSNPTRALSGDELAADILTNYPNIDVEIADDPTAALSLAMRTRESSQAMIVVTGSFYTLRALNRER